MKVPVHILLLTDPSTRIAHPVACHEMLTIMERVKDDTAENLEMSMAFARPDDRPDMKDVVASLRIVTGTVEYDG